MRCASTLSIIDIRGNRSECKVRMQDQNAMPECNTRMQYQNVISECTTRMHYQNAMIMANHNHGNDTVDNHSEEAGTCSG